MRSDVIKKGFERAPHRGLLRACGVDEKDFGRPFIGIANSFVEIIPGHVHLNAVGRIVKDEIYAAGGIGFEFNTIGVDDGIAMGHSGMRYSLPSREVIADSVETMVKAHAFDALLCIPNCDKIVPGMLMAAMRCNVPTIFVSGGPMAAGKTKGGEAVDLVSIFEGVGAYQQGKINDERLLELERSGCPTCGSCSGMFTANSMNCLCEALGMALPGNGTILAGERDNLNPARLALFRRAARQIMRLIEADIKPLDIVTADSLDNALVLDMAMGGSTNTVLHTLALANEAGIDYDLNRINTLSKTTPNICKVSPSSKYHMEDVDRAGGVSAILREISRKPGLLKLEALTVTGQTLGENIAAVSTRDAGCIRTLETAYSGEGGLSILLGSLAPDGAVVKTAGVDPAMLTHRGPAVIFESQEDACEGILKGRVKAGDVVVIRYEGPKGGPGMVEMLAPTSYIKGMGLSGTVGLVTDGRFSGGTAGACIGHVSPEAAEGGPICLLKDGDVISIDIPNRRLDVLVTDEELEARRRSFQPPEPKQLTGYLARYSKMVTSGSTGAVLRW